jgi:hypothetical protein
MQRRLFFKQFCAHKTLAAGDELPGMAAGDGCEPFHSLESLFFMAAIGLPSVLLLWAISLNLIFILKQHQPLRGLKIQ